MKNAHCLLDLFIIWTWFYTYQQIMTKFQQFIHSIKNCILNQEICVHINTYYSRTHTVYTHIHTIHIHTIHTYTHIYTRAHTYPGKQVGVTSVFCILSVEFSQVTVTCFSRKSETEAEWYLIKIFTTFLMRYKLLTFSRVQAKKCLGLYRCTLQSTIAMQWKHSLDTVQKIGIR